MSIQYKFFRIPIIPDEKEEQDLNNFLSSHRIQFIDRDFVNSGNNSFWAISVQYLIDNSETSEKNKKIEGKTRVDYKKILTPESFTLYLKLREWRKKISEKEDVALYAVFTNDQLSKIAEKRINNQKDLQNLYGVGESKISKYSKAVIEIVNSYNKTIKQEDNEEK